MSQAKRLFNSRFLQSSAVPGSWSCPCCGPAPKLRKKHIRNLKRGVFKRYMDKVTAEGLQELDKND